MKSCFFPNLKISLTCIWLHARNIMKVSEYIPAFHQLVTAYFHSIVECYENLCSIAIWIKLTVSKHTWHSIYIRIVSSWCLLSTLFSQLKLFYGLFGQSNMHSAFDFWPRLARKEMNVPLHKRS